MTQPTVATAINSALHDLFDRDERVYLIGEDILDPYGGAFKISRGLSTRWPNRVITTPISEGAIVGVSAGMALRGLRPVVEIMFGDFITLAFDQIVNHAAKFSGMYNHQVSCPLVIRTPMGGGRGYGPTHSQSLEKFLVGIPGIDVVAPGPFHDIGAFYHEAILGGENPTIIIEHKLLYPQQTIGTTTERFEEFFIRRSAERFATIELSLNNFRRADLTLVTYGGTTRLALQCALDALMEEDIVVEVLLLGSLSPLPIQTITSSVSRSRRCVVLEEGTGSFGIGAEVASQLQERLFGDLAAPIVRVAALDRVIPAARGLEEQMLPNAERLIAAVKRVVQR